ARRLCARVFFFFQAEDGIRDRNVTGVQTCALPICPSGGGKSTIARLAARFWDVTGSTVTLGGRDIRELPLKQLSREISFVTQDKIGRASCRERGWAPARGGGRRKQGAKRAREAGER